MQFASVTYLAFLALATIGYFLLPGVRSRTLWLLAASFVFYYSLSAKWTLALLAMIAIGYVCGLAAGREEASGTFRKRAMWVGIGLAVAILAFFKYTDFASTLFNQGLALTGSNASLPLLRIALPVGISFWTFQTIAYLVDVSRGILPAERNVLRYALFVSFFPQVTAGPIARGAQLLPQLATRNRFSYEDMQSGLYLIGWGLFKKLLVADSLAVVVAKVYDNPHVYTGMKNGLVLGIATVAFAVQIYCDLSGYTDIVRGSARLFGVDLLQNFNRPYFSRSIREFWQRWHMSLMSWLRTYVYFPLGGSRVPRWRKYVNILVVFLVSGLWHGAGLTFIAWGLLNAVYQIVGDLTSSARERFAQALHFADSKFRGIFQTLVTFLLVTVAWVFFRANSLSDALYIVPRMFLPSLRIFTDRTLVHLGLTRGQIMITLACAAVVFAVDLATPHLDLVAFVRARPLPVRWAGYLAGILLIAVVGRYGPSYSQSSFAYFKF